MKIIKRIFIIFIFLILILVNIIWSINISNSKSGEEYLKFIQSNESIDDSQSPKYIGHIMNKYEGGVTRTYMSKACYLFTTVFLPQYHKDCKDGNNIEKYYKKYAGEIFILTGIESQEQFEDLINKTKDLKDDLELEEYKFDFKNVKIEEEYVSVKLFIKYKECDEIFVNVKIINKVFKDVTSVRFLANE